MREANLQDAEDAETLLYLLNAYAMDPMGGGKPLAEDVARRLVPALLAHPGAHVLFASVEGRSVGFATCFVGFSTFAARPLLNVHDLAVLAQHRGRGVGRALLSAAESLARSLGCVKLSLEVLEDNTPARRAYRAFGFRDYEIGGVERRTLFLTKPLAP